MNFYPFHIGDYASATRHLTWLEDAAYRRMMDVYYTKEAPLPADTRQIYRLTVASSDEQREAVESVLSEFFTLTERGYEHARCEEEIASSLVKREKASQSAKTRWSNAKPEDAELPSQYERNANASDQHANASLPTCEGNAPNPNPNPNPNPKDKTLSNPIGLLVASPSADDLPPKEKIKSTGTPACPHQEIIALYHKLLPTCPRIREWTKTRGGYLKSRWCENTKRQSLAWWEKFFGYVADSEFLTGRGENTSPGRDPFVADLEWLIRPQNFVKVIEGKYHRESA